MMAFRKRQPPGRVKNTPTATAKPITPATFSPEKEIATVLGGAPVTSF